MKNKDFILSNGVKIPAVGLGTWQSKDGDECYNAVKYALEAGYRHIDTAYAYGNEKSVAKAIKDSNVKREDVFITTKLPSHIKTYEGAIEHFNESLANLDTTYVDLYLIHAPWPWSNVGENCDEGNILAWRAMIDLYNEGKIKSIGVSNFSVHDIENIVKATNFVPHVNQIRYFIGNTQPAITNYCQEHNILVEAYSPFATGEIIENEKLKELADKYNTTIPSICLQYCIARNTLPLPKSVNKERIINNINFTVELTDEDLTYLDNIGHIGSVKELRS